MRPAWNLRVAAVGVALAGGAYLAGRAHAEGVPTTKPFTYSGVLEEAGQPATGTRNLKVYLWDDVASLDAAHLKCMTNAPSTALAAGRFSVELDAACLDAVKANPMLWVEVEVAGQALGRAPLKAVPYAVEAARASEAVGGLSDALQRSLGAIGEVRTAMLGEAQFQSQLGTGWVLADGRDLAPADKYRQLTGETKVPDLRGLVLRGKNNGRSDGRENPDGDAVLGQYQADSFAAHGHGIRGDMDEFAGNGSAAKLISWYGHLETADFGGTTETGGTETRPRNVTVNYFIKIN